MGKKTTRTDQRYRILLTEIRTYEIEITSDTDCDLEAWARDGWEHSGPENDILKLVERRLAKVTVHKASDLPWALPLTVTA